ncbi:TetR/AcrR family transcriptional regulator [Herbihabitans rhizosphaerae]|uniref:TetR/AcrR family transcriptional regulator n=1 Tax=Herbihabitans rhizosphaerae TaxID=1872711 RepID=UPI0013EE4333|nr:TetR family transcriptional regulator C-terminal domain-containing protein [Herbihabitans rhizosphaerae]
MDPRYAERRRRIAEAVVTIVDRGGIEAASLRDVAAEAGVSLGGVQHYFRGKDEMMLFALEYVRERGEARVRERLGAIPASLPVAIVLREILVELLPTDERSAAGVRIATAFTTRALVAPLLADHLRHGYESLHRLLTLLIVRGKENGQISTDRDAESEAATLLALAEGLGVHVLVGHRPIPNAVAALDASLGRLCGD